MPTFWKSNCFNFTVTLQLCTNTNIFLSLWYADFRLYLYNLSLDFSHLSSPERMVFHCFYFRLRALKASKPLLLAHLRSEQIELRRLFLFMRWSFWTSAKRLLFNPKRYHDRTLYFRKCEKRKHISYWRTENEPSKNLWKTFKIRLFINSSRVECRPNLKKSSQWYWCKKNRVQLVHHLPSNAMKLKLH